MAKKIDKQALRAKIQELQIDNDLKSELLAAISEQKPFGLVWEEKDEDAQEILRENIPVLTEIEKRRILSKDKNAPNHVLIEGDNLHAITALTYSHEGQFDAIYIDPPYNSGATDWRYNNDYVDKDDSYRHSKWMCMMEHRLKIAKRLLNPDNSVLIVTIDEKEYLHLGCYLEQLFPNNRIQMITTVINPKGNRRDNEFSRCEEYIFFVYIGDASLVSNGSSMLRDDKESTDKEDKSIRLRALLRGASNHGRRSDRPNLFYPLLFRTSNGEFLGCGPVLPADTSRETYTPEEGITAMWPIAQNGEELTWNLQPDTLMQKHKDHFLSFSKWDGEKRVGYYLSSGQEENFRNGLYNIVGTDDDGAYIIELKTTEQKDIRPMSVWHKKSHSASEYGTTYLNKIIGSGKFSFPKSIYAVKDTIGFFVADKPNAKILDFFAGSGTTMHATMMLNQEDGGHRQCFLVTNNENNICEEVTYERNKRIIQGYKTLKGEIVDGYINNNLRYYKTEFVNRVINSPNRHALMRASVDLLCIKENIYNELETFGGRKFKKSVLRYFEEGDKQMLVIFDERVISLVIPMIAQVAKKESPMKVYVYSDGQYAYEDEFHEVMPLIDLCALPDAIYQALNNVLPEREYSEEMVAEFNQVDAEAALADTYNYKAEEGGAL